MNQQKAHKQAIEAVEKKLKTAYQDLATLKELQQQSLSDIAAGVGEVDRLLFLTKINGQFEEVKEIIKECLFDLGEMKKQAGKQKRNG